MKRSEARNSENDAGMVAKGTASFALQATRVLPGTAAATAAARVFPSLVTRTSRAAVSLMVWASVALLVALPLSSAAQTQTQSTAAPAQAVASAAGPAAPEEEAATTTEAATEETRDIDRLHVKLLGTAAFADGDVAQFQQRHRIPENLSGGIDALFYEREIGEDTELEIEGRAIFDNHDYLLGLSIVNEDKGFLKVGYREFRTWYDGRGGYFRPADAHFVVFDPELGLDRGEAWARGGLVLPAGFKLTMEYRYLSRDGRKSSTTWGDSTALGLAPPNNRRNIVPAFYDIDEERHQVEVALARESENTTLGTAMRYETTDLDNRRNVTRQPGELLLERRFTQRDNSSSDMFGARAFGTHHMLGDKITISGAYAYNDLELDLAGSRIYGANFNSPFNPMAPNRQQRDEGFFDLDGSTEMREHVGNLSMLARPFEDVQILAAFRVRGEDRKGHADFLETNVGAGPAFETLTEELQTRSDTDDLSYAEDLEVRYKGIDNVVLYARGQWEQNDGDIHEIEIEPVLAVTELERDTDVERRRQKYATGVKVYPVTWMNLSTEYSYRRSAYDYEHELDSTLNEPVGPPPSGDRYPAFLASQEFSTHNLNVRTTFRLPADVALVMRYDWLQTTIDTRASLLSEIESAQVRSHMFGGTVTWNPANWWWTRGGVNYVLSTTDTAANNFDTPARTFFPNFDNDYVTVNLATGMALDALTDVELVYHWFSADNFHDVSVVALPYGSRAEEHGVNVRAARRLNEHTKVALGYGYFSNDEGFAGGTYDYDVHLLTTSVEFDY